MHGSCKENTKLPFETPQHSTPDEHHGAAATPWSEKTRK